MKKFDNIILKYIDLINEEYDTNPPAPAGGTPPQTQTGDAPPQGAPAGQPPPPPAPKVDIASAGYTAIVKLIRYALELPEPALGMKDLTYSNNTAKNSTQAWEYIDIVKRNLPKAIVNGIFQNSGNEKGKIDIDDISIIAMANTAIKALFYNPKLQANNNLDSTDTTYRMIIDNFKEITPKNAKQAFKQIRDFLI